MLTGIQDCESDRLHHKLHLQIKVLIVWPFFVQFTFYVMYISPDVLAAN